MIERNSYEATWTQVALIFHDTHEQFTGRCGVLASLDQSQSMFRKTGCGHLTPDMVCRGSQHHQWTIQATGPD